MYTLLDLPNRFHRIEDYEEFVIEFLKLIKIGVPEKDFIEFVVLPLAFAESFGRRERVQFLEKCFLARYLKNEDERIAQQMHTHLEHLELDVTTEPFKNPVLEGSYVRRMLHDFDVAETSRVKAHAGNVEL